MIRIILPTHLRNLAHVGGEVTLEVPAPVSGLGVLGFHPSRRDAAGGDLMVVDQKTRDALDLKRLNLPPYPVVKSLEAEEYYDWAGDHRDYHFAGRADGARRLAAFTELFDAEVGDLTPDGLVAACLRP